MKVVVSEDFNRSSHFIILLAGYMYYEAYLKFEAVTSLLSINCSKLYQSSFLLPCFIPQQKQELVKSKQKPISGIHFNLFYSRI